MRIATLSAVVLCLSLPRIESLAQCPTNGNTLIEVCDDAGNQGIIRATFTDGTPPFSYILFDVIGPTAVSVPFGPVTINIIAPNIVEFGNVPVGEYLIRVFGPSSCSSTIGGFGITVDPAQAINVTSVVQQDCGPGNGSIDLTVTGGNPPLNYTWTVGPSAGTIGNNPDGTNLIGGTYHVQILDAENCTVDMDIVVPFATAASAGSDQTVCSPNAILAGNAVLATETGTWSVISGTGVFGNSNSPTSSVSGLSVGANVFQWTIVDNNAICPPSQDQVTITRDPDPTVNAGLDQTICSISAAALAGSFGGSATSSLWTTSGDGAFAAAGNPVTSYTPGVADIAAGTVTLTLTTNDPAGPCISVADQMILTIDPAATVSAGPDQNICAGSPVVLAGTFGGSAASITWSTSGDGSFAAAGNPATTYTPGPADILAGSVTLTISTNDPAGPCSFVSDFLIVDIDPAATVGAGLDNTICAGSTAPLTGSFGGSAASVSWTTSGDGAFANASLAVTTYTPGAADIAAGSVTLTLTTNDPAGPCPSVSDNMILTIDPLPVAAAGPDQAVCVGDVVSLTGSIGGSATSSTWTTSGDGSFGNLSNPITTYTPGVADNGAGTVTLTITTDDPAGPCVSVFDQVVITINPVATVSAGPDQTICSGSTANLTGTFGGAAVSVTWSTSGDGTFANASAAVTTYTPGVNDRTTGSATLTLTTNDPAGPCPAANDAMALTIDPVATANAGADQTVCAGDVANLAGAIGGSATSSTWTTSGTGSFGNAANPVTTYTPSAGDIAGVTVTLTLTTDDPAGPCPSVQDQVIVTINPAATVNAGGDQTICVGSNANLSGTIGGSATSSTWSSPGDGFFGNPANLVTTYTPGVNDIAAGTVALTLSTNDPAGVCPAVVDQLVLTIDLVATADAGPDQTICETDVAMLAGSIGGSAVSSLWTTSGDGVFADDTDPATDYSPGVNDLISGIVTLTLTTDDPSGPCPAAADQVVININAEAIVNAGGDQTVCEGSVVNLNGVLSGSATSSTWTTLGDGTFANVSNPVTTYTPGPNDVFSGFAILTLTSNDPAGPCPLASDIITITVEAAALSDAGPGQIVCASDIVILAGSIGGSASTSLWTTSGDGTFTDNTDPLTDYTPGAGDVGSGTVTLTLTTDDPAGVCTAAFDVVTVTINAIPTVSSGPDQAICSSTPANLNGSFAGAASSITWTTSGDGTFGNASAAITTYTAGPGDILGGFVTLTITTDDPAGSCTSVSDDVDLTIELAATVNAGVDQTICEGATIQLAGTFGGSTTTTMWNSSGDGTFDDATLLNAVYTPGANDITLGSVLLTLNSDDPAGACTATSDPMTLTVTSVNGDPAVFGNETWLAYVFDDSGDLATPLPGRIDFDPLKYRGFLDDADIDAGVFSSYDFALETFNFNSTTLPVTGPDLCGSYFDNFSIQFKMRKTFAPGVYNFTIGSDDGVRFFIDGNPVDLQDPNTFGPHAYTVYTSVGQCLSGAHDLVIEYHEQSSFSRVSFAYALVPGPVSASPVSVCVNTAAPTLAASSADPSVVNFKWYADAGLTTLLFTGASFTPSAAQLDITTVGTTLFFVTADYGCGETPSATVQVDVVNSATLTLPSGTVVCISAGVVDLTTIVAGIPSGGAFVFAGPGVAGNNFDPAVAGLGTHTINVSYVAGTCSANGSFDIDVSNTATATPPATTPDVCITTGLIDLTTLVTVLPTGGIYTFAGPGVAGNNFDPVAAGLGTAAITLNYDAGGCLANTSFSINVLDVATVTVTDASICQGSPPIDLLTLISTSPAGGTLTISGTGVAGTTFDPTGLTPGPYPITVGYDQGGCSDSKILTMTVSDPAATFTATDATCANNDGSILITSVVDGVTPYTYSFNGTPLASLPAGNLFSGLSAATHSFSVIDNAGCQRNYTIPIAFPGAISFTQVATNPDCNGNGTNGAIDVTLISPGTFNVGVTTDPINDPIFQTVSSTGSTVVSFPGLLAATYYLHVRSTGTECPSNTQIILAGPVSVTFTASAVDIVCLGSSGGIDLSNMTGVPGIDFTYEVLQGVTPILSGALGSGVAQPVLIADPAIVPGTYDVSVTQDQSATSGCPNLIGPAVQTITINGPMGILDTLYTQTSISYPEAPTGSMTVGVAESGQEPYEIRIELIIPEIPGQSFLQDFTTVSRNAANVMEYIAGNLYAGTYEVSIRDALGCVKVYLVDVPMDTGLLIPNIFTPNNDGYNDVFYIRNLPPGSGLLITNRWGKEIFSSKDYQNDWNAEDISDGIYYFKLDMPSQSMNGWLEIARGNK